MPEKNGPGETLSQRTAEAALPTTLKKSTRSACGVNSHFTLWAGQ
jgi:hypothetical protein